MWSWYYFSFGISSKKIEINQFTTNSSFQVYENLWLTLYSMNSVLTDFCTQNCIQYGIFQDKESFYFGILFLPQLVSGSVSIFHWNFITVFDSQYLPVWCILNYDRVIFYLKMPFITRVPNICSINQGWPMQFP